MFINFCIARPKYCFILCRPAVWQLWLNEYVMLCYTLLTVVGWTQLTVVDGPYSEISLSPVQKFLMEVPLLLTVPEFLTPCRIGLRSIWISPAVVIQYRIGICHGLVSVCVCLKPEFYRNGIPHRAGLWRTHRPTMNCRNSSASDAI